jgi:hypothetical protein
MSDARLIRAFGFVTTCDAAPQNGQLTSRTWR